MDNVIVKRCAPGDDEHREDLLNYITDDRAIAVGGNGVDYHDRENALAQMQTVTNYFDKSQYCPAVQVITTFDAKVKDPDTAINYTKKIVDQLPDEYQNVYCVHEKDRENNSFHAHIMINPVSAKDGKLFDTSKKHMDQICEQISQITGSANQLIFKRKRKK